MNGKISPKTTSREPTSALTNVALGKKLGLRDGDALIVTDVQRDFLPGGSLAVAGGEEVIAPLNACMAAFAKRHLPVFLTRDWHPGNHCSFQGNGGRWPVHCVQGTMGAEWSPELCLPAETHIVSKATETAAEAYSAFSGTTLETQLRDFDVRRLFIGGLTTDYCVHDTVLDARKRGFGVVVLANAIRAVNAQPGDETRAIRDMMACGARLEFKGEVLD